MRVFGFLIIFIVAMGFTTQNNSKYLLLNSKKFTVEGSTSIGNFTCDYELQTKDTLFLNKKSALLYKLPVKEFGCGNFMLNRDFRKTLKEKEYPEVAIVLSDVRPNGGNYIYTLHLNLAGKRKTFQNLSLVKEGKNYKGTLQLKFSDFDLTAPEKLGGAIKIKEEIQLSILLRAY